MKEKIIWVVALLALVAGGAALTLSYNNQNKTAALSGIVNVLGQRTTAAETVLNAHLAQPTNNASAAPVTSAWDEALKVLPACGNADQPLPDKTKLETLGFGGVMGKGYEPAVVCRDATSGLVAFIMAQKALTKPQPDAAETCVDSCDQDAIGVLNPATKVLKYVESGKKLGIYGEAYDQFCLIDKSMTGTAGETILFYCGSGESGGLTKWYQYELDGDKLTLVQELKSMTPAPTYDVKNQDLLKQFSRQQR